MTTTIQALPRRLREARKKAGLTQAELAKRAGITQGAISGFEQGTTRPNLETLAAVSVALGITVASLLEEVEPAA